MQEINHDDTVTTSPVEPAATATGELSLRKTARHISKRTTDLIAISIVGIGVITVSGRLAEWWQTDPTTVASPAGSALQSAGSAVRWGADESNVSILAGEQSVRMERKIISGNQDRVDSILRDRLINELETERPKSQSASDETFAQQEKRLLGLLSKQTPIETREGRWNIYRLDHADNPLPGSFLIATRFTAEPSTVESLAAWAIATPSGPKQWTSFVFTPTGAARHTSQHATAVPTDGQLLLSLRTDSHDELSVFQRLNADRSDMVRWTREMNGQLTKAGWHETRSWQQSENSTAARFERRLVANQHLHQAMELTISFSKSGKLTGTSNVITIPEMELVPSNVENDHTP